MVICGDREGNGGTLRVDGGEENEPEGTGS